MNLTFSANHNGGDPLVLYGELIWSGSESEGNDYDDVQVVVVVMTFSKSSSVSLTC